MNLKDKIIVITGASDGIGKQIALRLAKEGTKLALIARNEEKLNEVSRLSKEAGALDAKIYPCDLRLTDKLENMVKSIISDFGNVDILINDAGIWQKLMPVEDIEANVIDDVIQTNLTALIHITKLFIPYLKNREESAIINVISKSGAVPQEGQSVYTASKYGVRGFTEVLSLDLKDTNVLVAGVYQGGIDTKMFEKTGETFSTETFTNPADLADVIAYMLSRPAKIWLSEVHIDR